MLTLRSPIWKSEVEIRKPEVVILIIKTTIMLSVIVISVIEKVSPIQVEWLIVRHPPALVFPCSVHKYGCVTASGSARKHTNNNPTLLNNKTGVAGSRTKCNAGDETEATQRGENESKQAIVQWRFTPGVGHRIGKAYTLVLSIKYSHATYQSGETIRE